MPPEPEKFYLCLIGINGGKVIIIFYFFQTSLWCLANV